MSIIFAILLFSFLIFIHELGHFVAAKSFGVQVNEFSLFMGPAVWKKQIGQTLYAVRCIPIGGYCAMEGEDGDSDQPGAFIRAAWWKRLIILVAGAAMNFVVGVVMLGIFLAPTVQYTDPVVSQVELNCAFADAIQPGDRIWEVDGERIYTTGDFSTLISLGGMQRGGEIVETDIHDLVILRNGEKIIYNDLNMEKREFPNEDGTTTRRYGFSFSSSPRSFGRWAEETWNLSVDSVRLVRLSLQMLVTGRAGVQDVSGPVGIVREMSEVADASGSVYYALLNLIYFGGFIAINLAVMNLLPIPALDGGRIAGLLITTLIEAVTRKKINPKYEGYIHAVGMLLLLGLTGIIMFKDIIFAFRG